MSSSPVKTQLANLLKSASSKALYSQVFGGVFAYFWWMLGFINITNVGTNIGNASSGTDLGSGIWIFLLLWGGAAALCGEWVFVLQKWWTFINFIFPMAVYIALMLTLPSWVYLLAFLLSLTVFWNVRSERVPLYLSNQETCQVIHEILQRYDHPSFLDMGCGVGSTIIRLSALNPNLQFTGIENAPFPYFIAKVRSALKIFSPNQNNKIFYGDLWQKDLYEFDVVYCFLSPEPMPKIYDKAKQEMKSGSILISNSFEIPGFPPHEVIDVDDRRKTRLLIWKF